MKYKKVITKNKLVAMFYEKQILTLSEIARRFGCSTQTAKMHIKKCNAISCINKNSKYYSIPEILKFDKNGIWKHDDIIFSQYGTLKATIVAFITNSPFGLSGDEIGKRLNFTSFTLMARFGDDKSIIRKKISGHYIYFSSDKDIYNKQYNSHLKKKNSNNVLNNIIYIKALVKRIEQPNATSIEISRHLKNKGFPVTPDLLSTFFADHGIDENSEFTAVIKLTELLKDTDVALTPSNLFKEIPNVLFEPDVKQCCGKPLKTVNAGDKTIYTLHIGGVAVHKKYLHCDICNKTYYPQELLSFVPSGSSYGYDVMVHIGKAMFLNHQQAAEIQGYLQTQNINICVSEVEYLAKKFVLYLSELHTTHSDTISQKIKENGGFILHLDAVGEKGGKRLICGVDGISNFVLANEKIPTENSDYIIPFLEKIKTNFGIPLRVVQDMGTGIMKAVTQVFPGILILICHFHFLRDIGKDLLEDNYDTIRKQLRHFGILTNIRKLAESFKTIIDSSPDSVDTFYEYIDHSDKSIDNQELKLSLTLYTLIMWILEWKSESNGYGFPFDKPHLDLALRIKEASDTIEKIKIPDTFNKGGVAVKKYHSLREKLQEIVSDTLLINSIESIQHETKTFNALRKAMDITLDNNKNGLNDNGGCNDIKTIEIAVNKLEEELKNNVKFSESKKGHSFLKQIDKYRDGLFADPIEVKVLDEIKTIYSQRTNNIMEQMFRDISRGNKRKTGKNSLGKMIQSMVTDTPLVRNLKNEKYMKLILGDNKTLEEAFSDIDEKIICQKMKEYNKSKEKIPEKIQLLLKKKSLMNIILDKFNK